MTRNKRLIKHHPTRQISTTRRLQVADSLVHFLKFSPAFLRFRLLPVWVYVSLAVNGVLAMTLFALLLRQLSLTTTTPAAAVSQSDMEANAAQANLAALPPESSSEQRHQLNYQQWRELLAKEAEVVAKQRPDRLSILVGDSISLWFPANLLPPKRHWLNQGISGETSLGLSKRLDLLDETEPEAIFVMIGINDLLHGESDAAILDSQREIVRYLQDAHPQSQIVVQSILPHASISEATWEGRDRFKNLPNSRIQRLNRELEAIAQEYGVYFLDLYPVFANEQGDLRMDLSTDGLHLNPQGYRTWSVALQVYSREVLEPERIANEP